MSNEPSFLGTFQANLASLANNLERLAAESIDRLDEKEALGKAREIMVLLELARAILRDCDGLASKLAPALENPGHLETNLRIWLEVAITVLGSIHLDMPDNDNEDGVWVPRSQPTWSGSQNWFAENENDLIKAANELGVLARRLAYCIRGEDSYQEQNRWKPPPGYVGAKEIMSHHRFRKGGKSPYGSLLTGWGKRGIGTGELEKIEKDPGSGEAYYPELWVLHMIKDHWHPQSQKQP